VTWYDYMPIITGLAYTAAAFGYWRGGQHGLGFMYAAYALANVGLVWVAVEDRR
jgi:hypothetical protein